MERKQFRARSARSVHQRIGPALRAIRQREHWTLDEMARRCGISRAYLSRIEHGRSDVSIALLLRLAETLGVDILYFTSYQETSSQIEHDLRAVLREMNISTEVIPALLSLSIEAQGALLDGLRWLTLARDSHPIRETELIRQILNEGVESSISAVLAGIAEFGVDTEGFGRMLTQMEELPGERLVMSDRLTSVTTPNGIQIDPVDVFRSIFQSEPKNPALVRWWAQSLYSAVSENVRLFESRAIYPLAAISSYLDTGHWGQGLDVGEERLRQHIGNLVRALRTLPNFHVGFIDGDVPFNLLVKGDHQVMTHIRRDRVMYHGQGSGVALRYSRPDVVLRFRDYFETLWDQIPREQKDSESIANWLEQRVMTPSS